MPKPTLLDYLAREVVTPIVREDPASGQFVYFSEYMPCAQFLYETTAALGHMVRERIVTVIHLFCAPGHEEGLMVLLRGLVAARLRNLEHDPRDAFNLYFEPEALRLIALMRAGGAGRPDLGSYAHHRTALSYVLPLLRLTAAEGIGLGSQYSELTENVLGRSIDPMTWSRWHTAGFDLATFPPAARTISQRRAQTLFLIKPYVSALCPGLMEMLELRSEGPSSIDRYIETPIGQPSESNLADPLQPHHLP